MAALSLPLRSGKRHPCLFPDLTSEQPTLLTFCERSDFVPPDTSGTKPLRERAFVPTELVMLFGAAGLEVVRMWGGTAGKCGKRDIELDEMEIMVKARKKHGGETRNRPS